MKEQCIVITNPMIAANRSAEVTLSKFLRVISAAYKKVTVVGGNVTVERDLSDVNVYSWKIRRAANKVKRVFDVALLQLKMAFAVLRITEKNIPVYFWVGDKMLLPYLAVKIRGADIRYFIYGNVCKEGTPRMFTKISGQLIAFMANHADSVCVESPGVMAEWSEKIRNKRIRTIHLYTETQDIESGMPRGRVIGMLCRLTEGKHVIESILAFHEFHKNHPEYRMEIIGSGRQEERCREIIAQIGAEQYILMHGWVEHSDVLKMTAEWKYLLFPSDTEGMPNGVLEMMGQGVPPIASQVGGLRDILIPGQTGWKISASTEEGILAALQGAVADANYHLIAAAARKIVKEKYSLHTSQEFARQNT